MSIVSQSDYASLAKSLEQHSPQEAFAVLLAQYPAAVTFSSSFSYEDQVITHLIGELPVSIFTLDTGRLFKQTYNTWTETLTSLHPHIKAYYPDHNLLEPHIATHGPNAFYQSVDNRKQCCFIRKVEPLKRALKGNAVWITGLRAEHSPDREHLSAWEWDEGNGIIKYHPLLHWSTEEVIAYIRKHLLPYNSLHDQGFISIGCEPCTRAIRPGEDFRAGRWWWEDSSKKECGLHVHNQ